VDNDSEDGSAGVIASKFPWVKLVRNDYNAGFAAATNQAIRLSKGRYITWLNADTLFLDDSITALVHYLDQNPNVGVVGPMVLNADHSFQKQCKRGMPTPLASLCYFLRLDRLFPGSRLAGQYLLSFVPEDMVAEVAAVSGCCLVTKRELIDQIGLLDEGMFSDGEDIDWCVRAAKAGWRVVYCPTARLIHLYGQGGSKSRPFRRIRARHEAMWVFYQKHLRQHDVLAVALAVRLGIGLHLGAAFLGTFVSRISHLKTLIRSRA
jgi:GT2 family glycosyltransferase